MSGTNKNTFDVKKLLKSILAIVMVAAVMFGCVGMLSGCNKAGDSDGGKDNTPVDPYANMTDAEYMQAMTMNELEGAVDVITSGVATYAELAGAVTGNFGTKTELDLLLGELIIDMLEATLAESTNMTLDLSFLSKIGLDLEVDSTSELAQLKLGLSLSDTDILDLIVLANQSNVWASIPVLNDGFLEVALEDMDVTVNTAQMEILENVLEALPSEDELETVLTRYLGIAIKEIVTVERGTEKLELDGLKQDVTKLTAKIYEQNVWDAIKAILTTAKDDQDIKKIVDEFSVFYNDVMRENSAALDMEWTDVDLYPQLTAIIDNALANLPTEAEDTETFIGLTAYISGSHEMIGGSLVVPGEEAPAATYYTVTENNQFATLAEVPAAGLKITGKGATADGSIDGNFAIAVQGTTFLNVEVKDFDVDDDSLSGTVTLKPTADLLTMIFNTATPLDMASFALEMKLDVADDKANIEATLTGDGALIIGIALRESEKEFTAIQAPTDAINVNDYLKLMGWVTGIKLDTLIGNLTTAGVPSDLISIVENLIPAL